MVNTEHVATENHGSDNYNILNIVVNTEPWLLYGRIEPDYNILNIVVNTERSR